MQEYTQPSTGHGRRGGKKGEAAVRVGDNEMGALTTREDATSWGGPRSDRLVKLPMSRS